MMRGWSIRAMPVDQARHLPEAQCSPACWRALPDLPPPEQPTVCAFWPVPPGPAAICSILRTWVAVRSENTGMPTAAASLLSIVAGIPRPALANTVYERAIWNRLAEQPYPQAMVACSLGCQLLSGRRTHV